MRADSNTANPRTNKRTKQVSPSISIPAGADIYTTLAGVIDANADRQWRTVRQLSPRLRSSKQPKRNEMRLHHIGSTGEMVLEDPVHEEVCVLGVIGDYTTAVQIEDTLMEHAPKIEGAYRDVDYALAVVEGAVSMKEKICRIPNY